MRVRAHIWINAYIRRLGAAFIPAVVARKGDADAGAIFIKIATLDGQARVLRPAIAGWDEAATDRSWSLALNGESVEERKADDYLARQAEFDSDMWVIEIEDREGRHLLEDAIISE
ncbi:MAG TPA: DUF1491 family protein [Hyphomicrobiales bacterium]|nr:DUF1491 family protein [Hyphomicrobiales bacterium]